MQIKICGIRDEDSLRTACAAGAGFVGFVFYPPSPRAVSIAQARDLCASPWLADYPNVQKVGLFVNPDDQLLDDVIGQVALDMIQLHGDEDVAHVLAVKGRFDLPVIKAIQIKSTDDVAKIIEYDHKAIDYLLIDAGGGDGKVFPWHYLSDNTDAAAILSRRKWFLAGGLTCENIGNAIQQLRPNLGLRFVDVSSGVEYDRGKKDHQKIKVFIQHAKA